MEYASDHEPSVELCCTSVHLHIGGAKCGGQPTFSRQRMADWDSGLFFNLLTGVLYCVGEREEKGILHSAEYKSWKYKHADIRKTVGPDE